MEASTALESWLELLRLAQPVSLILLVLCFALAIDPSSSEGPRRRRSNLLGLSLAALALTFLASGILLVVRAVVPDKTWTPALQRWHNVEYQSLLGLVGIGSLPVLLAWQQRQHGPGIYSIGAVWWAATLGGVSDVAMLAVYALDIGSDAAQWKELTPWTWAQLGIQMGRVLVFWPILVVLASISADERETIEPSTAGTDNRLASNAASASAAGESTALLSATRAQPADYGGTTSAGPSSNGTSTPNKSSAANKNSTAPSAASAANASMGLSMASAPPPPTFRVFFSRILMLFPYLWPSKSPLLQLLALCCVGLLLIGRLVNIAVPIVLGKIVDHLASTESGGAASTSLSIWWLIGGYALLKCLQGSGGLLTVAQNFAWLPLQQYSDRSMSLMAFRHLLDLSMAFHTKRKTGEVLRILDRGSSINSFFQYLVFQIAPIFFDIAIATVFLSVTFGPQVGLLLFAIMTVYTAISVKMTTWRTTLRRDANNKDSVSRAIHTDVLLNWETVKSYNNESYEAERYRLAFIDYQGAEWKVSASLNALNLVQNLVLSVGTLLMLFVVAYDVTKGYATSSDFVVFISYLAQIYTPLNMLSTLYRVIQTSLVDTDKLIALLQEEKDVKDIPGATELEVKQGVVEFRDVRFSYDGKVDALKSLSFTMKPKSRVALVGESGAGKSSVLKLLYRFYDPSSGQILVDGQDIRTVTQASLRKAIGVVPQEAGLLNTSIRTNIGYGRTEPPATDEEVEAAAAAAQILDKIQGFPEGMDTVVGERGVRLSGGEKQRVAIARTFLKAPPILLLDEATSALDSQTERHLQVALQTLMEGKTSLTIAHRLSTIVNSDQIIVLSAGGVVESGTHEELVAVVGGRYAAMWAAQVETDRERADKERENEHAGEEAKKADTEELKGSEDTANNGKAKAPVEANAAAQASAAEGDKDNDTAATSSPPAPGMLGVVSPSQLDSDAMANAVSPTSTPAPPPLPAAVEAAQETEAEAMPAVVDEVKAQKQEEKELESNDRLAFGVDAPAVSTSTSGTAPPSRPRTSSGVAAGDAASIAPSTTSSSGAAGGGKMRTRIASLMRRTTSSSGGRSREGSPVAGAGDLPSPGSRPSSSGGVAEQQPQGTSGAATETGRPSSGVAGASGGNGNGSGAKKKNKKKGKK